MRGNQGSTLPTIETLAAVIREVYSETAKAIDGFSEKIKTRSDTNDDTYARLNERLTVLEERVLEVEKKLHMPPAA